MDAQWGVRAIERQYRDWRASRQSLACPVTPSHGREHGKTQGLVRRRGLGVGSAPRLRGRRRRLEAGRTHLPPRRRGAGRNGRLDRGQVRRIRPGHSGGDRSPARAGRREPHGPGVCGLRDQPEAARPVPRPLLARRRQGRQPRRPRPRRRAEDRSSPLPENRPRRPGRHRTQGMVADRRGAHPGPRSPVEPRARAAVALLPADPRSGRKRGRALVPRPLGEGSDAREGPSGSAPDPREPSQAPQDPADHRRPAPGNPPRPGHCRRTRYHRGRGGPQSKAPPNASASYSASSPTPSGKSPA